MARIKLGITLDDTTLSVLKQQAKKLGLSKSQYIALLINQKKEKGENDW